MNNSENRPDFLLKEAEPVEGREKPVWHTIGAAWIKNERLSIKLDSHPIGRKIMGFRPSGNTNSR